MCLLFSTALLLHLPAVALAQTHSCWASSATPLVLEGIPIDDSFFGVSSVSEDGYESPVVFPGPAGAFVSVGDPPAAAN